MKKILLLILVMLCFSVAVSAIEIDVDASGCDGYGTEDCGTECFETIYGALDCLDAFDEDVTAINVHPGVYEGLLDVYYPVTISGEDKDTTIIDCDGDDYGFNVWADYVMITGFTITNCYEGIYAEESYDLTITDNLFTYNYEGIYAEYIYGHLTITDNLFTDNYYGDDTAIYLYDIEEAEISNNVIKDSGTGIILEDVWDGTVSGNDILVSTGGEYGEGLYGIELIYGTAGVDVTDNTIIATPKHYTVYDDSDGPNLWSNNLYSDYMGFDTDGDDIGDDSYDNYGVLDATPRTDGRVTNTDTGDTYVSIYAAIYDADNEHTISVSEGNFYECVYINKTLTLEGTNKETTIIGTYCWDDPTIKVYADDVTISGFTITNSYYEGIYAEDSYYLTITDNLFTDNYYDGSGTAIDLYLLEGADISNNIIKDSGTGIILDSVRGSTVSGNDILVSTGGEEDYSDFYGIELVEGSIGIEITDNTIITVSGYDTVSDDSTGPNTWENNLYSDYMGFDTDGDDIGDDSYDNYGVLDATPRTDGRVTNTDTGDTYVSIYAAIYDADNEHTISVSEGNFYECVEINKPLTLEGTNKETTIIGTYCWDDPIIYVGGEDVSDVSIDGFTIINEYEEGSEYAIYVDYVSRPRISNVIIEDANNYIGIAMVAEDGSITDSVISNTCVGLGLADSSEILINGNVIDSNGIREECEDYPSTGIGILSSEGILIQDNEITNNNVGVYVDSEEWISCSTDVVIINNEITGNDGTEFDPEVYGGVIAREECAGEDDFSVEAMFNWWNHETGPGEDSQDEGDAVIGGRITYSPWYTSEEMAGLFGVPDEDNSLILPYATTMSLNGITVELPPGISITGEAGWTGGINAPSITELDNVPPEIGEVYQVIEIGFPDVMLTFDIAVRILIPNAAGKLVGYSRSEEPFTEITDVCAEDSRAWANDLDPEGDCKMDVDVDLVVWTKHFTEFVTYTPPPAPSPPAAPSSGSGGTCHPKWSCGDWSDCSVGRQTRECEIIRKCGHPGPETVRSCACDENWVCDDWSECDSSGKQTRDCVDTNECGMIADKPAVIQSCTYLEEGTTEVSTRVEGGAGEEGAGTGGVIGMITGMPIIENLSKSKRTLTVIFVLLGLGVVGYLGKSFWFKKK